MTKKYTYSTIKKTGDQLTATEWNNLTQDVEAAIDAIGEGTGESSDDSHIIFDEHSESNPNGKGNLTIQTTSGDLYLDDNKMKGGKINLEPISDLLIKSGDDISLYSHHREDPTEVSVKVLDGSDNPVKLLLNAANIVLTTKDKDKTKTGSDTDEALYDDPTVMNVTVNSAKNTRGYLKVRAQAIDLRCEDHGGVALQPKGYDNPNGTKFDGDSTITADDISNNKVRYMNKIKFEHGGGDGLEFGTFNTEKTSLYTNEYRFKKDGVWKMATRTPIARATTGDSKYKANDPTTHYYYLKQADDFYDVINGNDVTATTSEIIKAGFNLNKINRINISGYNFASGDFVDDLVDDTEWRNIITIEVADLNENLHLFEALSISELFDLLKNSNESYYGRILINFEQESVDDSSELVKYTLGDNLENVRKYLFKNLNQFYIIAFELGQTPNLINSSNAEIYNIISDYEYCYKMETNVSINNNRYLDVLNACIVRPNNYYISYDDIATLINYFKTGAGQANGPWANQ